MSGELVLKVEGIAKKFCPGVRRSLLYGGLDILAELLPLRQPSGRLRKGEFWALDDVDLTLHRGEAIAVLGHNGAGKSTLLKILTGLLPVDRGRVEVHGKIVALIELGAGLNPLLTGRENARLLAQLHGLSRQEAAAIVPAVIAFAELEDSADDALQTYSTGMRARLAYAIAASLPADILLVDEVLAVGDIPFQRKCIGHMQRFLAQGGALLLVSHAINHVYAACRQGVMLDHGRVVRSGDVQEVVREYLAASSTEAVVAGGTDEGADMTIDSIRVAEPGREVAWTKRAAELSISYRTRTPADIYAGFMLSSPDGFTCIAASVDLSPRRLEAGEGRLVCNIGQLPLVPGSYRVKPIIYDAVAHSPLPVAGAAAAGVTFEVEGPVDMKTNTALLMGPLIDLDLEWRRNPGDTSAVAPAFADTQERASSNT